MEASISLRPQYSKKGDSICNEHMKRIYNKKFNNLKSNSEQKTKITQYSDILLDCEYSNDIIGFFKDDNYIPSEWKRYKLDDVIGVTLFNSKETSLITRFDVDDFFTSMETALYYEDQNITTEDEQE